MKSSDGKGVAAVVLCAGSGTRSGLPYNKVLFPLGKKAAIAYVADACIAAGIDDIVLAVQPSDEEAIREVMRDYPVRFVYGGDTRAESVRCGLDAVSSCEIVVIHDGARPFVTSDLIARTVEAARRFGSGIAAIPAVDTVKQVRDGQIVGHPARRDLMCVQTPQSFRYDEIRQAYALCDGSETDDSEVYARLGKAAHIVEGAYENVKVTTPADLLRIVPADVRIGSGFDVHQLVPRRPLILGGVRIEHSAGLLGHSDADVLAHAVMDALLGAAGLPDIGVLFPDTDPAYKGADSLELLDEVMRRVTACGLRAGNLSAVVMAQKPKLSPFIPQMRANLAARLHTEVERIDISATTTEGLGIVGEEKGIAAAASCILHGARD